MATRRRKVISGMATHLLGEGAHKPPLAVLCEQGCEAGRLAGGARSDDGDGAYRARFFRPTSNRPDQRRAVGGLVAAVEEREMRLERRIAPPVPLRKNAFARRSRRCDDRPRHVDGYDDRAEVRRRIDDGLQLKASWGKTVRYRPHLCDGVTLGCLERWA